MMAEQPDHDEVVRRYAARLDKEPEDLTTEDYGTLIQGSEMRSRRTRRCKRPSPESYET